MVNINQNVNLDNNVNAVESITGNKFGPVIPTENGIIVTWFTNTPGPGPLAGTTTVTCYQGEFAGPVLLWSTSYSVIFGGDA